ncbi:DEAD/DEAH box RNA helicase [uncultured virus]|nr:DEAD/DEAH box RNA helicase [uncultured virus]
MALRIFSTGIRSGETITSSPSGKQNQGTEMVVRGFYPPSQKALDEMDPITLRDSFNSLAFFANKSVLERRQWLQEHATQNKDLYLEDTDIAVRFNKIGGSFFTTALSQETLSMLQKGNPDDPEGYWPIKTVFALFPRKPGSKARKPTLIFRPNNWMVKEAAPVASAFEGMYFDLDTLELKGGSIAKPKNGYLKVFTTEQRKDLIAQYAVVSSTVRTDNLTWENLLKLAGTYAEEMIQVRPLIEWFTPALHKSLIQKLIRTRCREVEYAGVRYPAGAVLLASFCLLLLSPGSFVPTIQRYVTGIESAFKRAQVSIDEDAFLEDARFCAMLYACAKVAQDDREWRPTDQVLSWAFFAILTAQQEKRMFDYDWHNDVIVVKEWNLLSFKFLLLSELRSFESDIKMVGSIYLRGGRAREMRDANVDLIPVMPLIHCLDHHSLTQIAYYMPYTNEDYSDTFKRIWRRMVGVNPRDYRYASWNVQDPDVQEIRTAQRELWISKIATPQPRAVIEGKTQTFTYDLDPSWLSGLVGPLEFKIGSTTALVVLRVDDVFRMTAVKKPSRDAKSIPELTEDERSIALARAQAHLEGGHRLTEVPDTLPQLKNAMVYLRGSYESAEEMPEYYLLLEGAKSYVKWSEFVHLTYTFPLHKSIGTSIENALLTTGDGLDEQADQRFDAIVQGVSAKVLRRFATYLEGNRSTIQLFKIGRDGKGIDYTVLPEDTAVFDILCAICVSHPAALMKVDAGFSVKNGPLMWSLRDRVNRQLRAVQSEVSNAWKPLPENTRVMWEHQRDIFEQMKERHLKGKRGHLLWVPVGLGKTLNADEYITWLVNSTTDSSGGEGTKQQRMPKYCVVTIPPSALDNWKRELDKSGIPYQVLDMRSGGAHKTLLPGLVNLTFHDHLRMGGLDEQLKTLAPEMLFIVDEFHKAMNKTIRTSIILEVVKLSADFIGMSGTIIKDTNHEDLIAWLETIVDFEVTEKNYWVAMNALTSRKVSTNVAVERVVLEAKLRDEAYYHSLVPKGLGGTAAQLNFKAALAECYAAVDAEVVRQAVMYIGAGEPVFIVARDSTNQAALRDALLAQGVRHIHLITKDTPITLTPEDVSPIQAVITTKQHAEGYTLTKMRISIAGIIFSNQATREQLDGRINRIGQTSPVVRYITVHAGLLSYVMRRYDAARSLSEALKGFAQDIGLEDTAVLRAEL